MIDPRDPGTQQLQLEQKRGRGRPATGKALSNAERQRRYREAQKAQRNEKTSVTGEEAKLREALDRLCDRQLELEQLLNKRVRELYAANQQIEQLKAELAQRNDNELMQRVELAEAERDAMGNELAKAKARLAKAAPTKRRYILQYRYEDAKGVHWHDDSTGDYGSKREAEKACKRMNEPGVSDTEWRVRERQWV